jgi:predicted HTH domain antitoxin
MNSTQIQLNLPNQISEDEIKLLLAIKMYELQKVTLGQAAKIAGLSKRTFIELLGKYHIPIFNYSPEELREELGL